MALQANPPATPPPINVYPPAGAPWWLTAFLPILTLAITLLVQWMMRRSDTRRASERRIYDLFLQEQNRRIDRLSELRGGLRHFQMVISGEIHANSEMRHAAPAYANQPGLQHIVGERREEYFEATKLRTQSEQQLLTIAGMYGVTPEGMRLDDLMQLWFRECNTLADQGAREEGDQMVRVRAAIRTFDERLERLLNEEHQLLINGKPSESLPVLREKKMEAVLEARNAPALPNHPQ